MWGRCCELELSSIQKSEGILDTLCRTHCTDVLELYCSGAVGGVPPYRAVHESTENAINIATVAEEDKDDHFETLNLIQNAYSFSTYQEILVKAADEVEKKSAQETTLLFRILDACIVAFL